MNKKKVMMVLFCIVLPLFLLLLTYNLVLFLTTLTSAQENVFLFLEGKGELAPEFTELEASHLEDVKKVMAYTDYVFYVLLLAVTIIVTGHRKDKDFVLRLFGYGGKVTVAAIVLLGVLSMLFFDAVFSLFHTIFFPQGNWIFAADSLLIQTFPIEFFFTISSNTFLLTLCLGILFILSQHLYRYVLRHRN